MPEDNVAQVQDAPQEIQPPADSPTETNSNDTEPSQGGDAPTNTPDVNDNVPFHKHPRWIEKQREIEDLKKEMEGYKTLRSDFDQVRSSIPKPAPQMPQWWKDAFGEGPESLSAYEKQAEHETSLFSDWENRVIERMRSEQSEQLNREKAETEKWQTFIDDECEKLTSGGKIFDRNELLKVVDEFSKDKDGNFTGFVFPFDKAYEILQVRKTTPSPTDTVRQKAAQQSVSGTRGGGAIKNNAPSIDEVRRRGWGAWRK